MKTKISGSTTTSTQGKRSAVWKTSEMQSTTGGSEGSALLESCSNNEIDSADDGRCASDVGSDADGDETNPKPKKFYFMPAKDLDLLMEVLNVRPYAAEHGFVRERYEVVTNNLNEHWETALCARTVEERFFRLDMEFKVTDCAQEGLTTAQVNAATVEFIAKQSKHHEDEYPLLREELSFKQTKAKMEEARWKEEFEFRKHEVEANAKMWSEEFDLRRSDMELRREELELLKYQLNLPPILNPSTQAND
ncbi:unnamed protein product [Phytophthora fragariaefolia]|uniref:Unnamed protein product n=1 Tax=Phytophthora fragariaefolia TaxID=1490495 RepID=A0A9W6XII9_9STRA|nr:unnamed protein product [Phytophthora fragariaefolia]